MVSPPSVLPVLLSAARAAGSQRARLGVGVGSGAGCVGCAACGAAAIGAGGGVGAGGVAAAVGVGVVTPAGTFLTDGAEACGATGCPLSLRSP